jgi:catechol 2,3-dioxygenase-like lactoylglutathione lyase family enzyme
MARKATVAAALALPLLLAPAMAGEEATAGRVTGLGGVFFEAEDPASLRAWYREHLGVGATAPFTSTQEGGSVAFHWLEPTDPPREALTVWSVFPAGTAYFEPSAKPFMLNFRVDDLDAVLARLRAAGAPVDEKVAPPWSTWSGWPTPAPPRPSSSAPSTSPPSTPPWPPRYRPGPRTSST